MCVKNNEFSTRVLSKIKRSLPRLEDVDISIQKSLDDAIYLTAVFRELNRIKEDEGKHLVNILNDYRQRVQRFFSFLTTIKNGETSGDRISDNLCILCYDEMLVIFLLVFSICDHSQMYMLDTSLRNFLKKCGILKDKYVDLRLMADIVRKRTLFNPYNFPIVLGMFLTSSEPFKKAFAEALNLSEPERDKEINEFTESFIYLMGIRNQIAHVSMTKQLYSIEKMETNAESLAVYFSVFQRDLERLLRFFRAITDTLKTEKILKKK